MKNNLILITDNHPLCREVANSDYNILEVDPMALYEITDEDFRDCDNVFDFTLMPTEYKLDLLTRISDFCDCPLYSEATINWGEYLLTHAPKLDGLFSAAFYSPNKKCEFFLNNSNNTEELNSDIISFFKDLNLTPVKVSSPGICFTMPRTVSMIINEAYFSLDENLATPNDLDTAMKFGVNYPLGPLDWAKKAGPEIVQSVLLELYRVTNDMRYRVSPSLALEVRI